MKNDPELVAQGAVILERKLDFQPFYFEQSLRVRILSQAGVASAEISDLPPLALFLEGQVTFPDGRTQPITKREDFLVRQVVSTADGTVKEGILIPSGVTADCVLDVRWREATARGRANQLRAALGDLGNLPVRCGDFWSWTLASAYPTRVCTIQMGKELIWPITLLGASGFKMEQSANAMGTVFTFRDLPGLPSIPYINETGRTSPKVVVYRPIDALRRLESKVPATVYWQQAVDFYFRSWYEKFVAKHGSYKAFSKEVREGLTGGPQEKAKTIAARVAKRIINLDQLLFDEKPPLLARNEQDLMGVSNLEYVVRSGYADETALVKLLFHILTDEGIQPKIGLVADKGRWKANPELRTPFQFSRTLLGVDGGDQPTLWLDPADRMVPAGSIPVAYQGTRGVIIDSATWQAKIQDLPFSSPEENSRTFQYNLEAQDDQLKVQVNLRLQGAPALQVRDLVGGQAPTQRPNWFKARLEKRGIQVSTARVSAELDLAEPLSFSAEGTLPLDSGRLLKISPFPGMDSPMYLPGSLPEQRREAIHLPYRNLHEASSTIRVPKGYTLPEPIAIHHANRWGEVGYSVDQIPESGDLKVNLRIRTTATLDGASGYSALKDFLQWVRSGVHMEITLEKRLESGS